ncbi:DUF4185 domain-containing protein [Cryptosporangium phraense]|uniref:DUF4185 domain-containing protein n=1 Tax=Cryptosporangium phraense TaxID=2593070 RepID=A0A545ATT1_9ACTN|nr:DUF4185 domain-containing protein [Cryptosporangium phraense]TQS44747.1 DUF4185 domain-containing protein [Cryptosporangium phraense]
MKRVLLPLGAAVVAFALTLVVLKLFVFDEPGVPGIESVREVGALTQHPLVNGRDNGQSTRYGDRSIWVFGDTVVRDPWRFLSSTGAATTDLKASDGIAITTTDVFGDDGSAPTDLIPLTPAEKAFVAAHATGNCAPYCGVLFGLWPGAIVADPARHRVLVFYAKLCRRGPDGSRCSGPLGHGLGTGIAAIDMRTKKVTRLTATGVAPVQSVEGPDPTLFFPAATTYTASATLVGDDLYVYGDCLTRCHVARVPASAVTDRSRWRFWSGPDDWSADESDAATNLDAGSAGNSIIHVPALDAWLNVYLPRLSNTLTGQIGESPVGPWSRPFRIAETDSAGGGVNYAGFAHPEYAEKNGLVQYFSYYQERTYQQRIIRVEFS